MAKKNVLNLIYTGEFKDMTIDLAEQYFQRAKGKYQDKLDKFNELYELYKKPNTNGEYDKNIVFELIEAEVDNNIYFPKVRSMNGRTEPSLELENILKSELFDSNYRELNDLQERNTYIFGGAITYVYWDRLSRNSGPAGKLKFKAIDPRNFIPQPGISKVDDMDYCFVIETTTKLSIANLYDLSTDDLQFVGNDEVLNIDPDLITVKTMYYKDKYNHICRFTWSGQLVLENDSNIYSDKLFYCTKCGALKEADEDECIKCKNTNFELKEVERRKVNIRLPHTFNFENGQTLEIPQEQDIEVTPYYPNRFPFVIRKNISSNDLFGISDAEMIKTSQALNNSLLNKLAERILKSGSIIALPKTLRNKFKIDNSELKLLYYDTPADANGIIVKTLQPQLGNEPYLMDNAYNTARQTLGITNTYQGREDNTAISSKAKQLQVQQTAGRLESKREMKKASLVSLFELMFEFILAYSYEYRGYYVDVNGEEQFKLYDNRLFLVNSGEDKYFYDDEYSFDIDLSATLENNREQMWEENRLNFSSGAYGDPADLNTVRMFWETMYKAHYPGAKEALDFIDERVNIQMQQKEIEQAYTNRELELRASELQSKDLLADRETATQANMANAKLLESLNKSK